MGAHELNKYSKMAHLGPLILSALSDSSTDGILILDLELEPVFFNTNYLKLWGLKQENMAKGLGVERRKKMANKTADPADFLDLTSKVLGHQLETYRAEIRLASEHIYDCKIAPILDEKNKFHGQLITYRDITAHKTAERQRNFLVKYDRVTGLLNRPSMFRLIESSIEECTHSGQNLGVLSLNISSYKRLKNHYGHVIGENALAVIGKTLLDVLLPHQASRHGEDEFLVLIKDTSQEEIMNIANLISDSLYETHVPEGPQVELTASFGFSLYSGHGDSATELVSRADIAMRYAQSIGTEAVIEYFDDLGDEAADRLQIETDLPIALKKNCFSLVYQPFFDTKTKEITGTEALLRWHCNERGFIPPNDFLPHAEESGLIIPIGAWVLRTACLQVRVWQEMGIGNIPVSVNVSAKQFSGSDFLKTVIDTLEETGVAAELLELELTETAFVENLNHVSEAISKLRSLGVRISIDDFGTGYSSLKYLRHFKVDTLKIDSVFTQGIGVTETDSALVATAIDMAHNLGLRATAEGVEDAEQLEFLAQNNCDSAQGFYLSEPISGDDFAELLAAS